MTDLLLDPIDLLTKDIKQAATLVSPVEARYLVDTYYQLQRQRIRASNQIQSLIKLEAGELEATEPHRVLRWLAGNATTLENNIKRALDVYAKAHLTGRWSQSICGIGPVLSAGLLAHIDITKAPTVGHIWRFAGLDPTVKWGKGEKRPWNASLKTLCWKIGESFVKVSGREDDVYGKLYLERKAYEQGRSERGELADQAQVWVQKVAKTTEAHAYYQKGVLPPGHLHARAKRWTVKLFLAHWHAVCYQDTFKEPAPKPYVLSQLQHGHEIRCPQWPF